MKRFTHTDGTDILVSDDALLSDWPTYTENVVVAAPLTIRQSRDILLAETDTWGLADYPATAEQTAYRQALRDITDQAGFPTNITWPTKPE
jgi:hypothetical protein